MRLFLPFVSGTELKRQVYCPLSGFEPTFLCCLVYSATDSQSDSPSFIVRHPFGTRDQFFFLLEMFLKQLRVCYFVAPFLTRGRACNLLLLLVLASAVPRDSRPYFIVQFLVNPPTLRARSPYLYPPGTGWPSYTPRHWVPFPSPLTTRRATVEVFYPASTRESFYMSKLKLELIYDRQLVGQSVLVPGTHLGRVINFFSLLEIFFRQLRVCYFVAPSLTRGRICNLL
jgi:hypothetical protein